MKVKLIEFGKEFLVIQMNHWILIAFVITIFGLLKEELPYPLLLIAMGAFPLALYFLRSIFRNFFLFFALHLGLPVMLVFVPMDLRLKIVVTGIAIVYVILSVCIKVRKLTCDKYLLHPVVSICSLATCALLNNTWGNREWEGYYILSAIIFLGSYSVYYFFCRFLRFLLVNESSAANIPKQEIFGSGMKQMLLFTLGGVMVLFLTANIGWVSYLLSWVKRGLYVLLVLWIKLFYRDMAGKEIELELPVAVEKNQGGFHMERENPGILWTTLENVILLALAVGLAVLVIKTVVKGIRYLWNHFHAPDKKEVRRLGAGIDIRETCVIEKTQKEAVNRFFFLSNRQKIRKIYRKQIFKNKNNIIADQDLEVLERMTAKECCEKILPEKDLAQLLQKIYEKARYSQEDVTAEDVRLVKSLGK